MRAALLVLIPSAALALSSRTHEGMVAWAPGGKSLLVEQRVEGPEGGGVITFHLLDVSGAKVSSFVLSSDMSPGGGNRESWQKIAAPLCRERAQSLAGALAKRGFTG